MNVMKKLCNILSYQTLLWWDNLELLSFSKSNQQKRNLKVAYMIEIITTTDLFANLKKWIGCFVNKGYFVYMEKS